MKTTGEYAIVLVMKYYIIKDRIINNSCIA